MTDHTPSGLPQPQTVAALRRALEMAVRQNSHDMLMTGEEIRQCEAALSATQPQTDDSYLLAVLQSHHSNNLSSADAIKVIRGLFAARPAVETVAVHKAVAWQGRKNFPYTHQGTLIDSWSVWEQIADDVWSLPRDWQELALNQPDIYQIRKVYASPLPVAPQPQTVAASTTTDAAADAFNNTFHKCRAEVSMDWWQRIWAKAAKWAWENPHADSPTLRSALGAMMTQFGMDEDEWSKPTFDQARRALSAPAVETVAVQEAIADERKSWADASAHDKEIASLALDCLAHRLTCRTPLPVAPKAEPEPQGTFNCPVCGRDTPHHHQAVWTLTAPDGRQWHGDTPIKACREEQRSRIPDEVAYERVISDSAQPVADRSAEEDRVRGEQTRFLNLVLDIRRVINWEKPLNGFEVVQELQEYIEGLSQGTRQAEPVALTDEQIIAAARTAKAAHWNLTDAGCVLIGRAVLAAASAPALQAPTHERAAPAPEPAEEYSLSWIEHEAESLSRSQPVAAEGVKDEAPRRMTMEEFERDDHGYSGDCA